MPKECLPIQSDNKYSTNDKVVAYGGFPNDVNVTISFLGRDGTILTTGVRWPLELVHTMFGPSVHCRFSDMTGWYYYAEVRL
jgi:hypothetical protein